MFTIQKIEQAHARVKSGADFPQYIQDIQEMGVLAFDTYVSDSHTEYYGSGEYILVSDAKYAAMPVAAKGQTALLEQALKIHQQGGTDYFTFCQQAATAGVEKWRVDMNAMTCTYYDQDGNSMVTEVIPDVK